ncbi:MAG: patatin-like phospholipase family protein [Proteobacteria bacterium]|nr:patatin-like phospholipase family protein [Pseudomonadota bacterium]
MTKEDKTAVSLVLGSGGARGLAHIGVIHWLEENGFEIRSISGSSMGALIGGVYAVGKLHEFEQWVLAITKRDIFTLLDLSFHKSGFIKGDRIIDTIKNIVGDALIEALPVTFTAVATNLETGKEVWIKKGPLFDAIRASISIPLLFTPFKYKGMHLVDGGVLNPVPIAPTFSDLSDITIAVNVSGVVSESKVPQVSPPKRAKPSSRLQGKISGFIEEMKGLATSYLSTDAGMIDIANQSFDAMQSTIARQKLAAYPPDISIEIPRNVSTILEFNRAGELIILGHAAAARAMKLEG